ncbi:response regulator [Curvivirga aplysinae]|uniref:response regulator n=1 Tax=Curvivirga aplysinae TaxID=2529852 RepID=UPI0012BC6B8C|nr:response regulator [Curvivirga aplysinae]MTI10495.1 response regulator [Curvivirga aplysinae]
MNKILIIDDERDMAQFVADICQTKNFDTTVVTTASEAIKAINDSSDYLGAVLDIVMPDVDGIELVQALGDEHPNIPVVLMSGYADSYLDAASILGKAHGVNIVGQLSKPFSVEDLVPFLDKIQLAS